MADLIDRQAAIDAAMEILDRPNHAEFLYTDEICGVLGSLPSAQPERIRPKAKDVYYEESDHCEFKCSLCRATIGVVEGGTLDGANFKYCPWCGAEMDEEVREWDA